MVGGATKLLSQENGFFWCAAKRYTSSALFNVWRVHPHDHQLASLGSAWLMQRPRHIILKMLGSIFPRVVASP